MVQLSISAHSETPPIPKIVKDSCPFECCQFGEWKSKSPSEIALFDKPFGKKVTGKVKPMVRVIAITGESHIFPQKHVIDSDQKGFKKGDVIFLMGHIPECGESYRHFRDGKELHV